MDGDVEALPVNGTPVSHIEMSVDLSIQCGFMVDWGLFVLARWFAAFPSASPAFVAASHSCGPALLVSWLCPGTCFQPCLWFIREWNDALDLEGLCDACGALAAASVYMYGNLSKPAAAAALPSAFVFTVALVGDLLFLMGAFADLLALVVGITAPIKGLFCLMRGFPAAASNLALALSVTLVGEFAVPVGILRVCWFSECPLCSF